MKAFADDNINMAQKQTSRLAKTKGTCRRQKKSDTKNQFVFELGRKHSGERRK